MPSCYTLACFTKPFKSLPFATTTQIRVPSPSRILSITKRQKRRCKMPYFLQCLFSKLEKKTSTPQPQNCLFSACKKPSTPSFAYCRKESNDSNQTVTSTDSDSFVLGNRPSKSVVFYSEPSRWTCDIRPDIRPSQRFDVSAGTSLVEEDVHVSDNGRSGAIALAIYTMDPCVEFRRSMQEMMDAHHVDSFKPLDWNFMQELLLYYLKLNENKLHESIIDAFLDLMKQIPRPAWESGS